MDNAILPLKLQITVMLVRAPPEVIVLFLVAEADAYSRTFAITVYEAGTDSYNCHAYA